MMDVRHDQECRQLICTHTAGPAASEMHRLGVRMCIPSLKDKPNTQDESNIQQLPIQ